MLASQDRLSRLAVAVSGWGPGDPELRIGRAHEVAAGTFRFLNHVEELREVAWTRRYVSHLWSYNLHYFDFAVDLAWAARTTGEDLYVRRFVDLAGSWVQACPPGRGDGWEPYPISLRIVNWIYALLLLGDRVPSSSRSQLLRSLASQAAFLERRLEYHILANHLQKNAKALVVAGLFFQGGDADRWLRTGLRLSWRELEEQVLRDGTQYERSPMYHAIALGDYLELIGLLDASDVPVPDWARSRVIRMVEALGILSRPDGTLHRFNDAADGIAPPREWLDRTARDIVGIGIPAPDGAVELPDAGYFGYVEGGGRTRLLIDCGEPGPRYQPGHAHCDLLSFELDVEGRLFVVDSGVAGYADHPLREYVRSTRAHNTVSIAGKDQSEIWGTYRVARRARVVAAEGGRTGAGYRFRGAYRPYHDPRSLHERVIEGRGDTWSIQDRVIGANGVRVTSWLHLHPDWKVAREGSRVIARVDGKEIVIEPFGVDRFRLCAGELDPPQGWYCPEFGKAIPAPTVEMVVDRNDGRSFGYRIAGC